MIAWDRVGWRESWVAAVPLSRVSIFVLVAPRADVCLEPAGWFARATVFRRGVDVDVVDDELVSWAGATPAEARDRAERLVGEYMSVHGGSGAAG